MPNVTVTTTNSTIMASTDGFKTVLVQNLGSGGLWVLTSLDANATVTSSTGVAINPNTTQVIPVHNQYLRGVSNSTSDVRYT